MRRAGKRLPERAGFQLQHDELRVGERVLSSERESAERSRRGRRARVRGLDQPGEADVDGVELVRQHLGIADGALTVGALQSSSDSQACNNGSQTAQGDSEVLNLDELDALDPLELFGCSSTDVDDEFSIPIVLEGVCNGDDTNGTQAEALYNTRRALGIDVLPGLGSLVQGATGLLGVNGSTSESLAEAPGDEGPECPTRATPIVRRTTSARPGQPGLPRWHGDECLDPDDPDCPAAGSARVTPVGAMGPVVPVVPVVRRVTRPVATAWRSPAPTWGCWARSASA